MKKLALILTIILAGCNTEKIEPAKEGQLFFIGELANIQTSRAVPLCTNKTPDIISYRLTDPDGQTYGRTADITLNGAQVQAEGINLPEGQYTITEITLLSQGTVTHAAANIVDPNFSFADFTNNPLPADVTVPGSFSTDLMCYTKEPIDPGFTGGAEIIEFEVMYLFLPGTYCGEEIFIEVDNWTTRLTILERDGLVPIYVPKGFTEAKFESIVAGDVVDTIIVTDYNLDGVLDGGDIIYFPEFC